MSALPTSELGPKQHVGEKVHIHLASPPACSEPKLLVQQSTLPLKTEAFPQQRRFLTIIYTFPRTTMSNPIKRFWTWLRSGCSDHEDEKPRDLVIVRTRSPAAADWQLSEAPNRAFDKRLVDGHR